MVLAQVVATAAICIAGARRFPAVPEAADRAAGRGREGRPPLRRLLDARLVARLGARHARDVAACRPSPRSSRPGISANAQAPATGFAALSGPARLVMLTEQTRDFEAGRHDQVFGMLRRYILGTAC